jgi:nucleoside-diphosphate-sugar epimerase
MEGLRICITGATGFIGRRLCTRLGDRRTWTAIGRTAPGDVGLPIAFHSADLSQEGDARAAIPEGTDVLVHLACYRGGDKDVTGHFRTTTAGTLFLCDAARRAGVKRIVLLSSTSVYEPALPADSLIAEDGVLLTSRPLAYGFTKKWAEDAARLQSMLAEPNISCWILRPGMVVGSGLRESSWVRSTIRRLAAGEPYPLVGERGHHLGLVALEDVIDALAVAIGGAEPAGTEPPGPVWNLVGEAWWERDVVELLASAGGVEARFEPSTGQGLSRWNEEPLSVAGDGRKWLREAGGITPRAVAPLLEQAARGA